MDSGAGADLERQARERLEHTLRGAGEIEADLGCAVRRVAQLGQLAGERAGVLLDRHLGAILEALRMWCVSVGR